MALTVFAGPAAAQDRDPQREADRQAIAALTRDMTQAFDRRDAAAIAARWTPDGEFIHNDGAAIRGRAAIQQAYAAFFQTLKGQPKLEVQAENLRFLAADTAVLEVALRLKDADDVVAAGRQQTLLVRAGGRWKAAIVREWDHDLGLDVRLADLAWLIGDWQSVTKERTVTVSYAWDANQAFIRGKFTVQEGGKVVESGTEVIGKDHARGGLRSWIFQADGGFAEGVWSRDGKKWSIDLHGTRADGRELTATILQIPGNPDTVVWQAVQQAIDGQPIADTPALKVSKVKGAN
jgi:uncharacterized protein (TIGR02246 family)